MNTQKKDVKIIYAGTFNPVHWGHVQVAKEVQANGDILGFTGSAEVLFLPVSKSRLKKDSLDLKHRIKMIELAIKNQKGMRIINIDEGLDEPRTHYERLMQMRREGIRADYWVIGSDTYTSETIRIFEIDKFIEGGVTLIVSQRNGYNIPSLGIGCDGKSICLTRKKLDEGVILLGEPGVYNKISSTEIRGCFNNNRDCSDVIPPETLRYVHDKNIDKIYSNWDGS